MSLPYNFQAKTIIDEGRTTQVDLDAVKNWSQAVFLPQLPEEFIILFLLSCRNDIAATKKKIESYFRIKYKAPELFNGYDLEAEDMKKILTVACGAVIPPRMENNTVIIFGRLNDSNYRNFDVVALIKVGCMLLDLSQINDPSNELVVVFDVKGLGLMHLTRLKIRAITSLLEYIQEAMPLKLRYVHILNANYVFEKMINLFRMVMKSELMATIKTHSHSMDLEEFHKEWVPASCMPKEYGGDLPCLEELMAESVKDFRKMKAFFEEEEKLRSYYKP